MDIENESGRLNSSSSSASSSSNNLLMNLPMPPSIMHEENMDADNNGVHEVSMSDDIHSNAAGSSNSAPPRPPNPLSPSFSQSQSQPPQQQPQHQQQQQQEQQHQPESLQPQPPTTLASSNNQIAADIGDDSVFITPFLYNNNSTSSNTTTSTTPSSSSTTTTPHQEHFPLSSSHQQPPQHHALLSLSSSTSSSSSSSSSHSNTNTSEEAIVPIIQQEEPHQSDESANIADTIDVSIVAPPSSAIEGEGGSSIDEDDDGYIVLTGDTATTSQQPHQRQLTSVLAISERQTSPSPPPPSTSPTIPPSNSILSLPSIPHQTEIEREQKRTQSSYPSYFTYPSGGKISSFYGNNNRKFGFGNGSRNIADTMSMFCNNDSSITAGISSGSGNNASGHRHHQAVDRIKMLYPNVNENETPLPRCWSPHDKCLSIGLSQNNLRVHYKGGSKQHSDAASVRTAHPIPPACGLYYFEVKIISKGKNGYMGIGLTAQQFRMNRLPGWDKQSYGYHGDDGNSFASSGNGQSYGPTFTTGDVIGCCVNFVNNTCFYTKNGIDLGIAFKDLPLKLYPTVGLQTPGEEVDANFGQEPFKFDQIEDMMKQMRAEMSAAIYNFPMPADQGDPTTLLHKMVSSYLVHNGHSQTAEAFARATSQTFREDLSSIRNRQKILKLVMSGRMGQAIEHTLRSYPGLLESNKNLLFMLKCRQFVEMVNGSDIEYCPVTNKLISNTNQTTQTTPPNQTSVIQSTKTYQNGKSTSPIIASNNAQNSATTTTTTTTTATTTTTTTTPPQSIGLRTGNNAAVINPENHQHIVTNRNLFTSSFPPSNSKSNETRPTNLDYINDVEMENNGHNSSNGESYQNGNSSNHLKNSLDLDEEMEVDVSPATRKYSHGIERILEFGKELSQMGQLLEKENKMKDDDRKMLEDAFSLIAYSNPWSSPLGWQLCPTKRENVCTALNSAILESMNYPRRPPLDICVGHANELLRTMAQASLGACAFVNVEDIFPQN